jgi:hypothetical protein
VTGVLTNRSFLAQNDEGDFGLGVVARLNKRLLLTERCARDTDSMAMAVPFEARAPFPDSRVLDEVWTVPSSTRCAGSPNKPFEWEMLRPVLDAAYEYRPRQGCEFAIREWLRDKVFRNIVRDALPDTSAIGRSGVNPTHASRLLDGYLQGQPAVHWLRVSPLFVLVR